MYRQHFGLSEKPFNVTPNPRFVFLSKQHREVFAHLLYGLQNRCGFIEITGEVGAGKTTALRTLFHQLNIEEYRLALIFNPALSADELLEAICQELKIPVVPGDRRRLLDQLNSYLLRENAAGRTVVLVIDEAQNLAAPVLEQIRLLSNLETETDKLIQIVLVGQPELGELLSQPNLRQFSQRISVRYHLQPMDQADTTAYIVHRLSVAGCGQPIFSQSANRAIYKASRGLPRLINILCDRALLAAYSDDRARVEKPDVVKAAAELLRPQSRAAIPWFSWLSALTLLASLVLVSYVIYPRLLPESRTQPLIGEEAAPIPATVRSEQVQQVRQELSRLPETESFSGTVSALVQRWHIDTRPVPAEPGLMPTYLQSLPDSGWQWTAYTGDLDSLLRLDVPLVLELSVPAVPGRRYLMVQSLATDSIQVAFPGTGHKRIPLQVLSDLYTGRAYILWRNYLQLASFSQLGQQALDVSQIQNLLIHAGYYSGAVTGVYDTMTIEAVTRLQADRGVVQDGRVGPLTLMLLYQQGGTFHSPRLISRTEEQGS